MLRGVRVHPFYCCLYPALPQGKEPKDGDPTPCPTLGSDHTPGESLVLPSKGNALGAVSIPIPGVPKKLEYDFPACLMHHMAVVPSSSWHSGAQGCKHIHCYILWAGVQARGGGTDPWGGTWGAIHLGPLNLACKREG